MLTMDRRSLLKGTGAGVLASLVSTRAAFAAAPTDNRLVLVFLRGGLDGLHALAPFDDRDYRRLRPTLALGIGRHDNAPIPLGGTFGLHPSLAPLKALYDGGELLFVPAASTRYRERSHFDGQNMLENGSGRPYGAEDGWLNRAILGLNAGDRRLGLALGPAVPLILQGPARVRTWANSSLPQVDKDFLLRLASVYAQDPLFAEALHDASGALRPDVDTSMVDQPLPRKDFLLSARAAADLLARDEGPRIAAMELPGWDTHFNQEQRLAGLLGTVAQGLLDLKAGLGDAWARTTVMVVSEFGRTAAENGSRGTDHGTGGLAILAGGAVRGGRIAGDWPGLARLYEDRDVAPVNDYEAIFKALLIGHLGLNQALVEDHVFPGNARTAPMDGLLRG